MTGERTLQDVIDEMTPGQLDFQALLVGAALEDDDVFTESAVVEQYDALTPEHKDVLDFLVGNILAEEIMHSATPVDNFLEHYGIPGMKWGVRNSSYGGASSALSKNATTAQREAARAKVSSGTGTLADAHVAALKTTGHRAINAFTGDKTFWRRTAITAGVSAAAIGAAVAAPAVIPAAVLGQVGFASFAVTGGAGLLLPAGSLASVGATVVTALGFTAAAAGATAATGVNLVGNTARAVGGNTRINRSYEKLGREVATRQTSGNKRVRKILNKSGSIPKNELRQSDEYTDDFIDSFLEHKASDTPWSKFSAADYSVDQWHRSCIVHLHEGEPDSKDKCKLPVREPDGTLNKAAVHAAQAALNGARGGIKLPFPDMIAAKKKVKSLYSAIGEKPPEAKVPFFLKHSDPVDAFLEHVGVKGMKWGIRRTDAQLGNTSSSSSSGGSGHKPGDSDGDGKKDMSVDSERFLSTLSKTPSQMSDREIKEANARAQAMKQYNELFNPTASVNADLKARVDRMRLEKDFRQLQAEATPPSNVSKLINGAGAGFKAFQQLDEAMGGTLKAGLNDRLGLTPAMSALDQMKASTDLAVAKTANIKSVSELASTRALHENIIKGDAPSLAIGYQFAGKRSASGSHKSLTAWQDSINSDKAEAATKAAAASAGPRFTKSLSSFKSEADSAAAKGIQGSYRLPKAGKHRK